MQDALVLPPPPIDCGEAGWPRLSATAGKPRAPQSRDPAIPRSAMSRSRDQNVNRIAPCMIRGSRAEVAWPKLWFTISPAGLNWALVLIADQFTWLNTLYISQRNWTRRLAPIWKFLNSEKLVLTIGGSRKNARGALPMSPRPVSRLNAAAFR